MPRGVAPRCPREGEGSEGLPERGGAPASSGVKPRLEFSQAQPRVDGISDTDRVDGISNTVHPLGAWQPSDSIWIVPISRIAGASSSSGLDAGGRGAVLPPRPS